MVSRDMSPSPSVLGSRLRSATTLTTPSREGTPTSSWRLPENHRISPAPPKRNNRNPHASVMGKAGPAMSSVLRDRKPSMCSNSSNVQLPTSTITKSVSRSGDRFRDQENIKPVTSSHQSKITFESPAMETLLRDILLEMKGMRQSLDTALKQNEVLQLRTDHLEEVVKKYNTPIVCNQTPPPPSPFPMESPVL